MAKDKERSVNPATAHLKSEKAKALKKSKANLATLRTEKLSRRNPDRLQKQLDELLAEEAASGGKLRPRDREAKERLEREIKAVRGAREKLGTNTHDNRERYERRDRDDRGILGKRGRGDHEEGREQRKRYGEADASDASDATDPDVRDIPMPRDTPPPVPRRPRPQRHELPPRPQAHPIQASAQTTYSSAPQIRNLQKEATSAFVPAAVAARLKQTQSQKVEVGSEPGKLLELEEVEALERAGYLPQPGAHGVLVTNNTVREDDERRRRLQEEEERFERELREAEIGFVDEAEKEAEYNMMAEEDELTLRGDGGGFATGAEGQAARAERHLRQVEVEEVSDEDG